MKSQSEISNKRTAVHFAANYLLNPANPLTVNVIGAGGTGSKVITALAEMNTALIALGHPGLQVALFDNDVVTNANLVRQRFADSELGMNKAVARINNINRWCGTNWKAVPKLYNSRNLIRFQQPCANIFITCVDKVAARFDVAEILQKFGKENDYQRNKPFYWLDFGNSKNSGQVILATVGKVEQPRSKKFITVSHLPNVVEEFSTLLKQSESDDDTPSCSAEEALNQQDLYINGSLTQMGCSLLWKLFREGMTEYRGFFHNLKNFRTVPIKVKPIARDACKKRSLP